MSDLSDDLWVNTGHRGFARSVSGFFYSPGFFTAVLYRLCRGLWRSGTAGRLLGVVVWRLSVFLTGCYISLGARIGGGLRLPHPVGIVIGEGVEIGRGVTIYQNVTIGLSRAPETSSVPEELYPRIEDGAVIYAGAVILGPIMIGANAIVAANAVVTKDVPAGCIAVGVPAAVKRPPPPQEPGEASAAVPPAVRGDEPAERGSSCAAL